jgi:hypothetical protein
MKESSKVESAKAVEALGLVPRVRLKKMVEALSAKSLEATAIATQQLSAPRQAMRAPAPTGHAVV